MRSSPESAKDLFSKWKQESRRIRFMLGGPPATVIGTATVEETGGDFLTLSEGGFTLMLDLDGAEFEYQEPREAGLAMLGLSTSTCVCCLSIAIDGDKRVIREPFGVVRLLLCELVDKGQAPR
jgi:hypothetical protein